MKNPFEQIYKRINTITRNNGPCPEFPLLVDMELASTCNLRCLMCEHTYTQRKKELMSEDIFKEVIRQCKPYNPGIRFIMYSEPFLHPDIISYAKYIKDSGLLLHITSNGILITTEQIDKLIDIGLDSITFSMQGATEKEYVFMRKNNKLGLIRGKIKYIVKKRQNKLFLQVSTTVSKRDKPEDIEKFKKKWSNYADLVTVGRTCWSRIAELEPKIYDITGIRPDQDRKYIPCQDILTKMAVYSNGDISTCCGDIRCRLKMGNILNTNMKELWHSEVYNGLRLLLKNMRMDMLDLCKDCYPAYEFKND